MAHYFGEEHIDEFRECFYLFASSGQIRTLDELTIIMRSLGMSPTISELKSYLKEKNGKITFPEFLKVMHTHSQVEKLPAEVIDAFKASDEKKNGLISAKHLRHLLLNWGEQLSNKEVDQIFREATISTNGMVKYEDFVKIACAPNPDYY
ncbi:hypothetical protein PGB90_007847 [Kerria lacca]